MPSLKKASGGRLSPTSRSSGERRVALASRKSASPSLRRPSRGRASALGLKVTFQVPGEETSSTGSDFSTCPAPQPVQAAQSTPLTEEERELTPVLQAYSWRTPLTEEERELSPKLQAYSWRIPPDASAKLPPEDRAYRQAPPHMRDTNEFLLQHRVGALAEQEPLSPQFDYFSRQTSSQANSFSRQTSSQTSSQANTFSRQTSSQARAPTMRYSWEMETSEITPRAGLSSEVAGQGAKSPPLTPLKPSKGAWGVDNRVSIRDAAMLSLTSPPKSFGRDRRPSAGDAEKWPRFDDGLLSPDWRPSVGDAAKWSPAPSRFDDVNLETYTDNIGMHADSSKCSPWVDAGLGTRTPPEPTSPQLWLPGEMPGEEQGEEAFACDPKVQNSSLLTLMSMLLPDFGSEEKGLATGVKDGSILHGGVWYPDPVESSRVPPPVLDFSTNLHHAQGCGSPDSLLSPTLSAGPVRNDWLPNGPGVPDSAALDVEARQMMETIAGPISMHFVTMHGARFWMDVPKDALVGDVRRAVGERIESPAEQVRLLAGPKHELLHDDSVPAAALPAEAWAMVHIILA